MYTSSGAFEIPEGSLFLIGLPPSVPPHEWGALPRGWGFCQPTPSFLPPLTSIGGRQGQEQGPSAASVV